MKMNSIILPIIKKIEMIIKPRVLLGCCGMGHTITTEVEMRK